MLFTTTSRFLKSPIPLIAKCLVEVSHLSILTAKAIIEKEADG
jgi:hypothetical protein